MCQPDNPHVGTVPRPWISLLVALMQRTCLYRTSGTISQTNSSQPVFSEVTWLCQNPILAAGVRQVRTAGVCMRREGPGLSTQIPKKCSCSRGEWEPRNLSRRGHSTWQLIKASEACRRDSTPSLRSQVSQPLNHLTSQGALGP